MNQSVWIDLVGRCLSILTFCGLSPDVEINQNTLQYTNTAVENDQLIDDLPLEKAGKFPHHWRITELQAPWMLRLGRAVSRKCWRSIWT